METTMVWLCIGILTVASLLLAGCFYFLVETFNKKKQDGKIAELEREILHACKMLYIQRTLIDEMQKQIADIDRFLSITK